MLSAAAGRRSPVETAVLMVSWICVILKRVRNCGLAEITRAL